MTKLSYITHRDWKKNTKENEPTLLKKPKNEFILSTSEVTNRVILEEQGLNASTTVLCLAAVGLDFILPNISFDLLAQEEILQIKEKLGEERIAYLEVITKMADESFDRINSGKIEDIIKWAQTEVTFKLIPKARKLEQNIIKLEKNTLKNAAFSFWKEGVPAIGGAYINGGLAKVAKVSGETLLKLLVESLSKKIEERKLPEISYALKISKTLE